MPVIRFAVHDDLPGLHALIERAYRGETARQGWTHEADLVIDSPRTSIAALRSLIDDPQGRILIAVEDGAILGCGHVRITSPGLAYLGLLAVEPALQSGGTGNRLLNAAEGVARDDLLAERIEMTVIEGRASLIAWYERRGYAQTGERRPFPVALDPPLFFAVLEKALI